MRKLNLILIGFVITVLSACSSGADSIQPVIALIGDANDTVSLNMTYTDPGATAQDNEDGNLTGDIVTTGNVNTNQKGSYPLYYNVTDLSGNAAAQVTRNVHVVNDADFLIGTYDVTNNCNSTTISGTYTVNLGASNTVNNEIYLDGLIVTQIPAIQIDGELINGDSLHFPWQVPSDTFYATGNVTGQGTFSLEGYYGSDSWGSYDCDLPHVKR